MPFQKHRQRTGGRPRGGLNKSTLAGRAFAERLVRDPEYLANLEERAKTGKPHPSVEVLMWHYSFGRPKEQLELSGSIGTRDVREMSTEELLSELEQHQRTTALRLTQYHGQQHS